MQNLEGNPEGEFLLSSPLNMEDKTFYVDEDFTGTDENGVQYVIKSGSYAWDPSMGEFGGYTFDVSRL